MREQKFVVVRQYDWLAFARANGCRRMKSVNEVEQTSQPRFCDLAGVSVLESRDSRNFESTDSLLEETPSDDEWERLVFWKIGRLGRPDRTQRPILCKTLREPGM